ncbi:MAG: hypothetical protein A2015_09535 [Spirochaetes bacterium GWF1_31_7]|nr:MAG: hypothetical protein A2Y30_01225 [Spirochaetes bacterium GWE1_32_154]OHD45094.1 MAG: hypothetical protein A2Y29_15270 [Spirochaetes bacterium GWE2_31_10]OHD52661.1 MAG: hypothetical protein A2015_09535 [Spirochaetes bacterium GWF1_31_7]OHD75869.1 MAG: hypothetical protein A2355_04140 [Spirochaetes bacterium RIFOXYB1_FULL_32_8]
MNNDTILYTISNLKEKLDKVIALELSSHGIKGLVLSHCAILEMLVNSDGQLKMKELTEMIKRTKSTVTELVNKLEINGYVTRSICTVDGRVCYVKITAKGRELSALFNSITAELICAMYDGFNVDTINTLVSYLEKVEENLE